ncbi:MAG: hypothetical protein JWP29_5490 [Rhodoferax sp.]|nr:hypothetical protein [Rhodoferax sp.]
MFVVLLAAVATVEDVVAADSELFGADRSAFDAAVELVLEIPLADVPVLVRVLGPVFVPAVADSVVAAVVFVVVVAVVVVVAAVVVDGAAVVVVAAAAAAAAAAVVDDVEAAAAVT